MTQYWKDLRGSYWEFLNAVVGGVKDYFNTKGPAWALEHHDAAALHAALTTVQARATLVTMLRDAWAKRVKPGGDLAALDATYTKTLNYFGKLGGIARRPVHTLQDLYRLQDAMKKWLDSASRVSGFWTEQKAAAQKTGLEYDPTIEYWQDIQMAFDDADPMMMAIRYYTNFTKDLAAKDATKIGKDVKVFNKQMAAIQQTYSKWVNRPAPLPVFAKLQTLFVETLKFEKPLADDAQAASMKGDWNTYFKDVKMLVQSTDRMTKVSAEILRVSKQVHLVVLIQ